MARHATPASRQRVRTSSHALLPRLRDTRTPAIAEPHTMLPRTSSCNLEFESCTGRRPLRSLRVKGSQRRLLADNSRCYIRLPPPNRGPNPASQPLAQQSFPGAQRRTRVGLSDRTTGHCSHVLQPQPNPDDTGSGQQQRSQTPASKFKSPHHP